MRKWAKIIIKIGAVICCVITLLVGLGLWLCFRFDLHTGYIRHNPTKTIAYLERVCDIDFPEDIKEVKIATDWAHQWDSLWTTFIIKFRIDPNSLESFVKLRNFKTYERDSDVRNTDKLPLPKWFTKPIGKGRMGDIDLSFTEHQVSTDVYIYIDTSDEKSFIVYMFGALPPSVW